jgi:5-methylcytosine-specific restriction enzyme subunit McrC
VRVAAHRQQEEFALHLRPKLGVRSIFAMLDRVFQLELTTLPGIFECTSLEEFYARIAQLLASRIAQRIRRGLARAYIAESDSLPYLRPQS